MDEQGEKRFSETELAEMSREELVQLLTASWDRNDELTLFLGIDPLTGAKNRRGIDDTMREEMSFSGRTGDPLCVIAIDVDDFKHVNDTFGHPAGDTVLRGIVASFRSALRPYDIVGRPGGDEIDIILRKTNLRNAHTVVAERLRRAVENATFSHNEATFSVTVSLGVAEMREGEDAKKLLEAADTALYEAKRAGRNCVRTRTP